MRKSFHRPFPLIGARLLYLVSRHIVAQNATTANGFYSALPLFPSLPQREEEEPHRHRPMWRTPSSEVTEVATTEIATTFKIWQTGNTYIRK